jgi:hypothetical protein
MIYGDGLTRVAPISPDGLVCRNFPGMAIAIFLAQEMFTAVPVGKGKEKMEFRWIAIITLWTLLAGPMFDSPLRSPQARSLQGAKTNK